MMRLMVLSVVAVGLCGCADPQSSILVSPAEIYLPPGVDMCGVNQAKYDRI